jgi:transcriptional regulator with XRE-family HTH domain
LNDFYNKFIHLCAEAKKSPSSVASAIGLSSAAVTGWKNGKKPSNVTVIKVAKFFGVHVDYFFENEEELEETEKPTGNADELSEEEIKFIEWYRSQASDKEKALVRMIVEGDR